jgi:hypothetical protein
MPDTLVIQSHRAPLPYAWVGRCLDSVQDWCARNRYDNRFLGDELFSYVPAALLRKTRAQPVIATDLARLRVLQAALDEGYRAVVWLDADVLVFDTGAFVLPDAGYAVGRETWVQPDGQGRLRVYRKVHNAFLLCRRGNPFLAFYADTAERLLALNEGTMPPQYLGPKLLTALHNIARLPVLESAGMLSPALCRDLLLGAGPALDLFRRHAVRPLAAANLCISSCERGEVSAEDMARLVEVLLEGRIGRDARAGRPVMGFAL